MKRLMLYFRCSPSCLVLCAVYIDRVLTVCPDFDLNDLTVHRLTLATLTVAAKVHDDIRFPNSWYAKMGGVSNRELNVLEGEFLQLIQWRVYVSPEDYERCERQFRRSSDSIQQDIAPTPCVLSQPEPSLAKSLRAKPPSRQCSRPGSAAGWCSRRSVCSGLGLVRRIKRHREPSRRGRCTA